MTSTLDVKSSLNNSIPFPSGSSGGLPLPASYVETNGHEEGAGSAGAAQAAPRPNLAALPCLYSNNSNARASQHDRRILAALHSTSHRKAASSLAWNIASMVQKHGLPFVGFLTLTFPDHVTCAREAQRRFNSLLTGLLRSRYLDYVWCLERTKRGRVHFHLVVALPHDIRTGFDFSAISKGDYRSANSAIRSEWAYLRKHVKAYGFGRTELLPIKSTAEGISRYVGKYLGKDLDAPRKQEDKGMRRYGCSNGARMANTRFQFVTKGSKAWRDKVASFVNYVHTLDLITYYALPPEVILQGRASRPAPITNLDELSARCGPRWAFYNRETIANLPPGLDVGVLPGYFLSYEQTHPNLTNSQGSETH